MIKQINVQIIGFLILCILLILPIQIKHANPPAIIKKAAIVVPQLTIEEKVAIARKAIHVDTDTLLNLRSQNTQLFCMAQNNFFEARGETFIEKVAVSDVVRNRLKSRLYPNDICGVIKQKTTVTKVEYTEGEEEVTSTKQICQFSWHCANKDAIPLRDDDGNIRHASLKEWRDSVVAAMLVYHNKVPGITGGATNFYAHGTVTPTWKGMVKTRKVGGHTFMKRRKT